MKERFLRNGNQNSLLTNLPLSHRIPSNMYNPCFGTMSMTTTSRIPRGAFELGQK
jgi:hypothetical protein